MKYLLLLLLVPTLFLTGCHLKHKHDSQAIKKYADTDRFKHNLPESQYFTISPSKYNVIEGNAGNLIIIPLDAIVDADDEPVKDSVQIELSEASDISEMILSNVAMQDPKAMVETHLAFYINATRKGKQLYISKQHPLYIEVQSDKALNLYKGTRSKIGDMQWDSVISPVKYLLPVPMEMLNFYPNGFEEAVEAGLPYKNHKTLTKQFLDSLYGSFAFEENKDRTAKFNKLLMINMVSLLSKSYSEAQDSVKLHCGINPASIRAISDKKFQNTIIATREFEMRLQLIFETCNQRILELYVNNLHKNLWEIDQMVANLLGRKDYFGQEFDKLSQLKQTTVKISEQQAKALASFYLNKKNKIEKDVAKLRQEIQASIEKQEKNFLKKIEEYKSLLETRHEYRMKKFGFELTDFGWYNAVSKTELKDVETFELKVSIANGANYDRAYTYVVNPRIKSIFSLLSSDKINFNQVYAEDPDLLLWKYQQFNVISVGYKNEKIGYKIGEYTQQPVVNISFNLDDKSLTDFKKDLAVFNRGYRKENKIFTDLDYQALFYKEKLSRQKASQETVFMDKLRRIVFRCCYKSDISPRSATVPAVKQ